MTATPSPTQRHVFAVIVDDEPGVLARVIGLFSGRGYNIESLTVANVDGEKAISRITIVSTGTPMILEQIEAQLNRLVPVRKVVDLTRQGSVVERETALVKINGAHAAEARNAAANANARTVETSPNFSIFEITGTAGEISAFIDKMRGHGLIEVVRSGVLGVSSGKEAV